MYIKNMKASFGMLSGDELELKPGLNIITAPNEGGKSSWTAFLLAMLFGINSSERAKKGVLPDKSLYAPWSGNAMEGSMDISFRGRDITLSRTGSGKAPMSSLEAVYSKTAVEVPELSGGADAGELLTGVSKGVYQRSAFIRQPGIGVSDSPELEKRIASIVSTGDELSSYTETSDRLKAWQRRRKFNKSGDIPQLEEKISLLREKLKSLNAQGEGREDLEAELKSLTVERGRIMEEMTRERKRTRHEALDKMSKSQQELRSMQWELDSARQELKKRSDELEQSIFAITPPEELDEKVNDDASRAARLRKAGARLPAPWLAIIFALLCLGGVVGGILLEPFMFFAAAVCLGLSIWAIVVSTRAKKAALAAREELDEILGRYKVADPGAILDLLNIHREMWSAYIIALDKKAEAEANLEAANRRQAQIDAKLLQDLDFSAGETKAARLGQELKDVEERIASIRESLALIDGQETVLGDPQIIQSEINALEAELEELRLEYDALELAIQTMAQANTEIQAKFSPGLGERASAFMSRITGEKYDQLSFKRDFEKASARRRGDTVPHDSAYLSAGTLDQLYLSLRLAICELALPSDEACPVILDDALINFDDERMKKALDLLCELSNERQILLFSCHSREASYLDGREGVNIIRIG